MVSAATRNWLNVLGLASATALSSACGVGFDSAAKVQGVRVLGVQKSTPYARPGDTVDLRMLHHDETDEERAVQIMWLQGCENPPGDLVQLCFEVFSEVLKQAEDVPPPPEGEPSEAELAALLAALQGAFDP
jgi:hypothetical protein